MNPPLGDDAEVILDGGITNEGLISRIGATVRRPARGTSPATRALLEHLERAGFDGAPRYLGRDERGREVVSFVEGEAPIEPYPDWALTDDALVSVAELLRRYHEAVASFDASGHEWPRAVPSAFRGGLLCHNDPNLDNIVFSRGVAVALIDFDLAGPGSAVWGVACAVRLWAPLRDERDVPQWLRGRTLERLKLFAEAYGLPGSERAGSPRRSAARTSGPTTSSGTQSTTVMSRSAASGTTAAAGARSARPAGSGRRNGRCAARCAFPLDNRILTRDASAAE